MELVYLILAISVGYIVADQTPDLSGPGPATFAVTLIVIHLFQSLWRYLAKSDD